MCVFCICVCFVYVCARVVALEERSVSMCVIGVLGDCLPDASDVYMHTYLYVYS
jgi:hypothetical protein